MTARWSAVFRACRLRHTGDVMLTGCQDPMVSDVPTREAVPPPTMPAADARCSRVGCARPAVVVWNESTTGEVIVYCAEDSVEAYNLITRWMQHPEQRVNLDRYAVAVEKASNRPLYGQPMFDRPPKESLS